MFPPVIEVVHSVSLVQLPPRQNYESRVLPSPQAKNFALIESAPLRMGILLQHFAIETHFRENIDVPAANKDGGRAFHLDLPTYN
jgi:hypothetical protein